MEVIRVFFVVIIVDNALFVHIGHLRQELKTECAVFNFIPYQRVFDFLVDLERVNVTPTRSQELLTILIHSENLLILVSHSTFCGGSVSYRNDYASQESYKHCHE